MCSFFVLFSIKIEMVGPIRGYVNAEYLNYL